MSLTIGEVHTGLLLTSSAVSSDTALELLATVPGERVRTRRRPIRYAWSPEILTGVDCLAPMAGRKEVRVVGTPATQLSLTDGRIVQAGTYATFRHDTAGFRRPWSHYLSQPGILEVLGKVSEDSLSDGFLRAGRATSALDLYSVNARALASVQRSSHLDQNPPFRSRRTTLRWSAESSDGNPEIVFVLGEDGLRTVRLRAPEPDPRAFADFCTDLAKHDWLLSTLVDIAEKAVGRRRQAGELVDLLRPGIDHLAHAWMLAVHVSKTLEGMWRELDLQSGFSLQWQKTVERIRDQLSVGVIEALKPFTQPVKRGPT